MVDDARRFLTAAVCGASGLFAALCLAAPALAEPVVPVPAPPAPGPTATAVPAPDGAGQPMVVAAAPAPADVPAAAPAPADVPAAAPAAPPDGVPHLASPDALPPGSTMDPSAQPNDNPNVSYLRDLWHAVQNQEISGKEALILGLAQRGMNTPYPQQMAGPNVPMRPADPAAAPPLPAGAPVPPAAAPLPAQGPVPVAAAPAPGPAPAP